MAAGSLSDHSEMPTMCVWCLVVGGLLSAHLMSRRAGIELEPSWPCSGPLLRLAEKVARKLLPGQSRFLCELMKWSHVTVYFSDSDASCTICPEHRTCLSCNWCCDHITLILRQFHWLTMGQQVQLKITVLVMQWCLTGQAPVYQANCRLICDISTHWLHSTHIYDTHTAALMIDVLCLLVHCCGTCHQLKRLPGIPSV